MRSQIKSIYRFGERSSCDRKFEEFKFCLSLKVMHPEEQREAWIRRRAEWWANRRLGKSSEDVWDIRESVFFFFSPSSILNVSQGTLIEFSKAYYRRGDASIPNTSINLIIRKKYTHPSPLYSAYAVYYFTVVIIMIL